MSLATVFSRLPAGATHTQPTYVPVQKDRVCRLGSYAGGGLAQPVVPDQRLGFRPRRGTAYEPPGAPADAGTHAARSPLRFGGSPQPS